LGDRKCIQLVKFVPAIPKGSTLGALPSLYWGNLWENKLVKFKQNVVIAVTVAMAVAVAIAVEFVQK